MTDLWLASWLYVIAVLGLGLAMALFVHRRDWDPLRSLVAVALVVLVLHVFEEWRLPGGLWVLYNFGSPAPDRFPMSQLTDSLTNGGAIICGALAVAFWRFGPRVAIAFAALSLFEVVIHVAIAFQSLARFGAYGQMWPYAPGLVTAVFGFLPVGLAFVRMLRRVRPTLHDVAGGVLLAVALSVTFINLLEGNLRRVDSRYPFDDAGYYRDMTRSGRPIAIH